MGVNLSQHTLTDMDLDLDFDLGLDLDFDVDTGPDVLMPNTFSRAS